MDSATWAFLRNSPRGYYLQNVLYTQYFTIERGVDPLQLLVEHVGYAGSHGS